MKTIKYYSVYVPYKGRTPKEICKMNNKELTTVMNKVGKKHGYEEVTAEFAAFRDFKVKWTRSPRWISFEVSDYLSDAPEEVLESLAETIFEKIKGDTTSSYSEVVCDYITTDEFVKKHQPIFIRRFRGLSNTSEGTDRDLAESYDRLVDMGLVEKDSDLFMGWANNSVSKSVGKSSVLMKVVAMSTLLDNEDVSESVLDYCLYSQIAHIQMGFNPSGEHRGAEYDNLLSRFPNRAEMEWALRKLGMYI